MACRPWRSGGSRLIATPTVEYLRLVPAFILAGIGMGLFFAPIANVVLSAVRPEEEGKASGATNAIREIGGVFGVAVLASVFSANGSYVFSGRLRRRAEPGDQVGAVVVGARSRRGVRAAGTPRRTQRQRRSRRRCRASGALRRGADGHRVI